MRDRRTARPVLLSGTPTAAGVSWREGGTVSWTVGSVLIQEHSAGVFFAVIYNKNTDSRCSNKDNKGLMSFDMMRNIKMFLEPGPRNNSTSFRLNAGA